MASVNSSSYFFSFLIHYLYYMNIFIFSAKILVATDSEEIEIIDLINPKFKCQITDSRMGRSGCVGGLLRNVPLICGGCRGGSGEGRFINQFSYFIYGLNGPLEPSCWSFITTIYNIIMKVLFVDKMKSS